MDKNLRCVFSLVVATIHRTDQLENLLVSLQRQTFKYFEVIIVDQNKDDRLCDIIEKFSKSLSISHIRLQSVGVCKARNLGWSKAQGEIIAFPDDDSEYSESLLEEISKAFNHHLSIDVMTVTIKDRILKKFTLIKPLGRQTVINRNNIFHTAESSFFIRTKADRGERFDETFGLGPDTLWGSAEGIDLLVRLVDNGARILYLPNSVVYHPEPVLVYNEKAFERSYKYGIGLGAYLTKHRYSYWHLLYRLAKYIVGIIIGILQFNLGKTKFYAYGFAGRLKGAIISRRYFLKNS